MSRQVNEQPFKLICGPCQLESRDHIYKLTEEIITKYNQEPEFHKSSQIFQVMIDISYTTEEAFKNDLTKAIRQIKSVEENPSSNIDPMSIYQDILMESKQVDPYLILFGILG